MYAVSAFSMKYTKYRLSVSDHSFRERVFFSHKNADSSSDTIGS